MAAFESFISDASVPIDVVRELDRRCDEFESQLADAGSVEMSRFLQRLSPTVRERLLYQLCELAVEHLRRQGEQDPGTALIRQNSALADEITGVLAKLETDGEAPTNLARTLDFTPSKHTPGRRTSRGLQIRCPHCSNHVELLADTPYDSIDCTVCGSAFSLVAPNEATKAAATLQRIDRFELVSRLGVGGFGTVWKARDTELDRAVAVKIPRRGQLSSFEAEQFLREARAAAQLRHPSIVSVHEVGRDGDNLFIVSDLIRGITLSDWLTGEKPTPREAAALCVKIADALDHAHRARVIHRDLKPSNIMIDDEGEPHLMDFGLAKREVGEIAMTADGQVLGTPAYMSPEQARGEGNIVDRRTDIYSLGIILFELVSGELPFRGNFQMQVHRRQIEDAPNLRTLNKTIPKDLATICAKCLERAPGRRYARAEEVRDELNRFLSGRAIHARPLSRPELAVRWAQRNPALAMIAILITVLAIGGPTAAILIEQQRMKLDRQIRENSRLVVQKNKQDQVSNVQQETIHRLNRSSSTWEYWPPNPQKPPHAQQLAALLKKSKPVLTQEAGNADLDPLRRARAHLALAIMQEAVNDQPAARQQLAAATRLLRDAMNRGPSSPPVALTLAEAYKDLSRLEAGNAEESRTWLEKSADLYRLAAQQSPNAADALAGLMDAELRLAMSGGGQDGLETLQRAALETNQRMQEALPTDPINVYQLACALAGRHASLASDAIHSERSQPVTDARQ